MNSITGEGLHLCNFPVVRDRGFFISDWHIFVAVCCYPFCCYQCSVFDESTNRNFWSNFTVNISGVICICKMFFIGYCLWGLWCQLFLLLFLTSETMTVWTQCNNQPNLVLKWQCVLFFHVTCIQISVYLSAEVCRMMQNILLKL